MWNASEHKPTGFAGSNMWPPQGEARRLPRSWLGSLFSKQDYGAVEGDRNVCKVQKLMAGKISVCTRRVLRTPPWESGSGFWLPRILYEKFPEIDVHVIIIKCLLCTKALCVWLWSGVSHDLDSVFILFKRVHPQNLVVRKSALFVIPELKCFHQPWSTEKVSYI